MEQETTPEQTLWQEVLLRAARDATAPRPSRERDQAQQWFQEGGRDFRLVCSLAGLDPDGVRECYLSGRLDREAL